MGRIRVIKESIETASEKEVDNWVNSFRDEGANGEEVFNGNIKLGDFIIHMPSDTKLQLVDQELDEEGEPTSMTLENPDLTDEEVKIIFSIPVRDEI